MISVSCPRPGARPLMTCHSSVTGASAGSCCSSPSTRVWGVNSTKMRARRSNSTGSSVLPGQSPPTALMWVPGRTSASAITQARRLAAVTVVTMSAPSSAWALLVQQVMRWAAMPAWPRLSTSLRMAWTSMSKMRSRSTPSRWVKARAWNSDCDPAPISAMLRQPCRASRRAASAEVAAVRSAVASVRSDRKTGRPVATSARAPNAITVGRSRSALSGWPLTYLKA